MRVRTAVLVLRLRVGPRSRLGRPALGVVLRAADRGAPGAALRTVALRTVARVMKTHGQEAVFRSWLMPSVSGPSPQRWTSPLVAGLVAGLPESPTPVPAFLLDAAWSDWLEGHGSGLWSLLERWGPAPTISEPRVRSLSRLALGDDVPLEAGVLVDAALRFDHPIGERARARLLTPGAHETIDAPETIDLFCAAALNSPDTAAFCAEHHLAPADQVQRAVFFVRTGQPDQYRALDPDGSLLALGYRGASDEERSALRAAMSGLGVLDVLHVLAGQGTRQGDFTSLTEHERRYLVERLADRRDWDQLWSLTLQMPLPEAVRTVDEFGDWRPSGEDDRRVFEALRAADPQAVARFVDTLAGADPLSAIPGTRIRPAGPDGEPIAVGALDFAPDGTQLAFAGRGTGHGSGQGGGQGGGQGNGHCFGILDLRDLAPVWLEGGLPHPAELIAHLGSDAMVVVLRQQIHYAGRSGTVALATRAREVRVVQRIAGDRAFMVTARDPEERPRWGVFVGRSGGLVTDSGLLRGMVDIGAPRASAVDARGRLIAVADADSRVVVADLANSAVNKLVPPLILRHSMRQVAISPSAIVCATDSGALHLWHEPLTTSRAPVTISPWKQHWPPLLHLAWSPALDRFLAVTGTHLKILDMPPTPDTPAPEDPVSEQVPLHPDIPRARARCARVSPRGDLLAVGGLEEGTVDVYVLTALALRPFVASPMGVMSHRDLTKVIAVMENPILNDLSRQALGLLRTCLEHRFRHDVGIGERAASAVPGDHEIELGELQEREGDA